MSKSIIAIAATLAVAAITFAASAEAGGGCNKGGFRGGYQHFRAGPAYDFRAAQARRQEIAQRKAAIVAAKKAEAQRRLAAASAQERKAKLAAAASTGDDVAEAAPKKSKPPVATVAALHKPLAVEDAGDASPIVSDADPDEAGDAADVTEAAPATCKRFIASAGLTVDVACAD
ncbi:MAG: hypothetical protein NW205_12260 [Hyphomicrobiaceae bacterium]|nr:hypothetical protein [Hyphomicrobiaceae bacterium]